MAIVKWDHWSLAPRWGFRFPAFWDDHEDWFDASEGISLYEDENNVVVEAAVPGVPAEKVDIAVEGSVITIKADYQTKDEQKKGKKVVYRGSHQAKYFYQASLPASVNANRSKAEVDNGLVKITIPKAEEAKPKRITVTSKKYPENRHNNSSLTQGISKGVVYNKRAAWCPSS